jgi:nucleotide-binding universal stress UspA family protein
MIEPRRIVMFTHILCPTDLKERAFIALKTAVQIAHQFNSRITMLNVHDEFMNQQEREMLRMSSTTRPVRFWSYPTNKGYKKQKRCGSRIILKNDFRF